MKNYSILRVNGVFNDSLILKIKQENGNFNSLSYKEALNLYEKNSFVYSFSFTQEFEKLGNAAYEVLVDFKDLQFKWAKENNFDFDEDNWTGEILFKQIEKYKPDIIYFQSHHFLKLSRLFKIESSLNTIELIKSKFDFIKKIIVYSGYPTEYKLIIGADIVFFSPPAIKQYFKKAGIKSYLMYHFFDEKLLDQIKKMNCKKKYNLTFLGSSRYPETRYFFLHDLLENSDILAWVYENENSFYKNLSEFNDEILSLKSWILKKLINIFAKLNYETIEKFRTNKIYNKKYHHLINKIRSQILSKKNNTPSLLTKNFPDRCFNPVFGLEYYQILYNSKISLNIHADLANGCVGNMRMFESTGMGTCLVSDNGSNLKDLFEDGKEIVTFKSPSEAKNKIHYLINNPKEAEKIAKAGQLRTLKDHNTKKRCEFINDIISNDK